MLSHAHPLPLTTATPHSGAISPTKPHPALSQNCHSHFTRQSSRFTHRNHNLASVTMPQQLHSPPPSQPQPHLISFTLRQPLHSQNQPHPLSRGPQPHPSTSHTPQPRPHPKTSRQPHHNYTPTPATHPSHFTPQTTPPVLPSPLAIRSRQPALQQHSALRSSRRLPTPLWCPSHPQGPALPCTALLPQLLHETQLNGCSNLRQQVLQCPAV